MADSKPETGKAAYNPLDKRNLGISVADALLARPLYPLTFDAQFDGAGIYAIYYSGGFRAYQPIVRKHKKEESGYPIYVGKAIPAGGRKGGTGLETNAGFALYKRLTEHAETLAQARNLEVGDFQCHYLAVDDIWIPLGERLLIGKLKPAWNLYIDGFGNHDPGSGRHAQKRSPWDTIHPGRAWADKLRPNTRTADELLAEFKRSLRKAIAG